MRMPFTLEILDDATRCIDKRRKTRPPTAHQTPRQAKQKQSEYAVAKAEMPRHGITPYVACDNQADDAHDQSPMENSGWQIPNASRFHVSTYS